MAISEHLQAEHIMPCSGRRLRSWSNTDTYGHLETTVDLGYTDKSTRDIVRHTAPYTVDIATHKGLDIVVLPMDRESSQ